jgi:carbon storage regulator
MLVLSRKRNEKIIIGGDIEICVVDIRGDKVRIGVTAPRALPVHREEVQDAIRRKQLSPPAVAASAAAPSPVGLPPKGDDY